MAIILCLIKLQFVKKYMKHNRLTLTDLKELPTTWYHLLYTVK